MTGPKPLAVTLALLVAAGTAGCAGERSEEPATRLSLYDTWDTDRDSLLDNQEFAAGPYHSWYSGTYNRWDADGDGFVSDEEYSASPQWHADTGIGDWDTDRSGQLDEREFYAGTFERWDTDRDGRLDQDEFYAGAYETWDSNRDGVLSQEEFEASTAAWPGDTDIGDFASWDTDSSGLIESDEFYDSMSQLSG